MTDLAGGIPHTSDRHREASYVWPDIWREVVEVEDNVEVGEKVKPKKAAFGKDCRAASTRSRTFPSHSPCQSRHRKSSLKVFFFFKQICSFTHNMSDVGRHHSIFFHWFQTNRHFIAFKMLITGFSQFCLIWIWTRSWIWQRNWHSTAASSRQGM